LRENEYLFYPLLAIMWTTQWTMRIERWRARRGQELAAWLVALGEFEALVAIAAYAYENPQDPFPEFAAEGPVFAATGMGHPLMDVRTCVPNDLRLGGDLRFLLVTGSNMSSDKPAAEGLSFDYRLRPGKVDHSNALKIIKMMGIPLDYAG
jgi:DNA mismatch repair ATPase MutS